ncbi:sigma-70 family RNA polymerase sigma factor [Paenibacillus sp. B1-33]|uniref:sigma-70 family RNA polymerase sigma factor n=1 Tax=unclassified Paenibacillus TaxID=185978 RepID=UPI003D2CD23A
MLTVDEVRLAQQGDCEAFIRLITGMERSLYRVARSILKRDEDCADVIQEAIFKAFRAIHTLREPAYFQTWMFRILMNECHQLVNKQKRVVVMADLPMKSATAADDEHIEYLDLIAEIDRLEDNHRIVISLHYFEDMSVKDIAELLDTSEGTIKSRLHWARATLAKVMDNPFERKGDYETC